MKTLQATLESQITIHESINATLRELRLAVVMGQTETITELNSKLMGLGKQLKVLESERKTTVAKLGFAAQPLRDIIPNLPIAEQSSLKTLRERLNNTIGQIQGEQEETQVVLEHSMDWVKKTMGAIATRVAQLQPETQSYGNTAKNKKSAKKSGATTPTSVMPAANSIIERKA